MVFSLVHVLVLTLLVTLAASQNITGFDTCRNASCSSCAEISISSVCYNGNWPLTDLRDEYARPTQCRTFCDVFSHDKYAFYAISSNCTYCQKQEAYDKYSIHEDRDSDDSDPQYCVPRQKCIDECGPELDGCIYTGTCGSQICFMGKDSGKRAQRALVTFDGPGTVLRVDNTPGSGNGTLHSTSREKPSTLPWIIRYGWDYCTALGVGFRLNSDYACGFEDQPLKDPRKRTTFDNRQCRSVCDIFDRSNYEVLRVNTQCDFCNSQEAEDFFAYDDEFATICIPQTRCRRACGQEPQGCVYSGSCRSLICFSGRNSRRPASLILQNDTGDSSYIFIDNSGTPISEDPPVFNEDLPTPSPSRSAGSSATPVPSARASPSASYIPNIPPSPVIVWPSPSRTPLPPRTPSPSPGSDDDGGTSIWAWLGPVIGVAVVATVAGVMIALYIAQRRSGTREPAVTI